MGQIIGSKIKFSEALARQSGKLKPGNIITSARQEISPKQIYEIMLAHVKVKIINKYETSSQAVPSAARPSPTSRKISLVARKSGSKTTPIPGRKAPVPGRAQISTIKIPKELAKWVKMGQMEKVDASK